MRSNAKSSTKKPSKVSTAKASDSSQDKNAALSGKANKTKPVENESLSAKASDGDMYDEADVENYNELYTLRYDINDRGIGKILLPPSLSTLLQSDRVTISPAAGGLFIRSL
jgi:hypothetical protein